MSSATRIEEGRAGACHAEDLATPSRDDAESPPLWKLLPTCRVPCSASTYSAASFRVAYRRID